MSTSSETFVVSALPSDLLEQVRRTDRDASGNPPARMVAEGGEPLRCCLRDATAGEALMLFGFEPPTPRGPYREIGPVFAHDEACRGWAGAGYPSGFRGRAQILRAYDDRGWIHDASAAHDGSDAEGALAAVLAAPGVVEVHSRNVVHGCYMFGVTRG